MLHKNLSVCFIVLLFIIFTVGANAFNLNLDEIVVTGTRTERKIMDVPIRTEIISLADIKSKHAFNLYETLEGVPGLRVEQQCSNCNFTLLRMGGMSGGYTSILLDGQPLLSALAQVYSLQQIGTADIERIEVVKGTGSALYGAQALAGVVNIIYREPTVTPVSNFRITLGSHGLRDYSAFSSVRRGDYGISLSVQKTLKNAIDENNDYFTDRVESDNLNAGLRLYSFNTFKENDKLVFSGKAYREFRIVSKKI